MRALVIIVLLPDVAYAHAAATTWQPGVVLPLVIAALLYAGGVARLWTAARPWHGVRARQACAFAGGWLALVLALVSPLHRLGERLFVAHMVQHELLMLVAAPLLVLGHPLVAWLWALPAAGRRRVGALVRSAQLQRAWRIVTHPLAAWLIHALVLWGWHAPRLFDLTLTSDLVHGLQHVSFLGAALLFWWTLSVCTPGVGLLSLFTTSVHSSVLGALLVVSSRPWYVAYGTRAASVGLTPLADQQLGGLVMWVPAGLVYVGAGLYLLGRWLREAGARTRRHALAGAVLALVVAGSGCTHEREARAARMTGGNPDRGREELAAYGCDTCHTIPGVPDAVGRVGTPLGGIASRVYLAGVLPNTPSNMIRWIRRPREIDEHTAMPDLDVTDADARDIAAYLYTLE